MASYKKSAQRIDGRWTSCKGRVGKLTLLAFAVGVALTSAGCGTLFSVVKGVETETSKTLLNGANDIILTKEDGIAPAQFQTLFERQFSVTDYDYAVPITAGDTQSYISFTYKDRKYQLTISGRNDSGKTSTGFPNDKNANKFLSASKCLDMTQEKK